MNKKKNDTKTETRVRRNTDRGSSGFNQGSKKDDSSSKVISVSDEEKRTGHRPNPDRKRH